MPLSMRLSSPLALYRKLERESYRAFHAKMPLHKSDHFFNFCVTAASMRDYVLEHLGMTTQVQKQQYYETWTKVPALVAASEIANSSKHFLLRDRNTGNAKALRTRALRMKKSEFLDVYANDAGATKLVKVVRSEVSVTLSDGQVLELYAFTAEVMKYWKTFLISLGLKVRRQPFAQLASG